MLLRLTDGTTTLTLSGSGAYLGATYFPSRGTEDEVTETIPVILEGEAATIRSAVIDIERLLQGARRRLTSLTPRVWLEFRPIDTGDIFRSEVFDGDVRWNQTPNRRRLGGTTNTVEIAMVLTRRNEWQGPEEEVYLSSSTQTERIGGVTIYNNDNGGNPNWVGIASTRVKGTRPAAVRLRITNASGGGVSWHIFHIGNNVYSAPASADVWLLGSEAVSGASASWGAGIAHNALQWLFPLSATLLGQAQGRWFRVLAAFDSISAAANLRASMGTYIGIVFAEQLHGNERYGSGELVDLGLFPVPPGGYNVANSSAALAITVRSASSGSGVLDFVQLMPTDSYRKLEQIGYVAANGDSVEDDGIEGGAYMLNGSNRLPIVRSPGDPLRVFPGVTQRLHVLFDEQGSVFTAGRQMTVQAWYRPIYDNI